MSSGLRPHDRRPARAASQLAMAPAMLATATAGFALSFWAWELLSPGSELTRRYGFGGAALVLAAVPLAVGSLGRVPVGWLTDRYGARVMLPAITVAAALPVLALASADSVVALLVAGCALGVAGTVFPVGAAVVVRACPPGRRGLALTVFGAGMGGGAVAHLTSRFTVTAGRDELLLLAVALFGCAGVAAAVVRDGPAKPGQVGAFWPALVGLWRLPATRHLSTWYAATFGSLVAAGFYLPVFLQNHYRLSVHTAMLIAAAMIGAAALARPVGGWLCERRDPATVFTRCCVGVAALSLILAFRPPLDLAVAAVFAIGACLGASSGVVLALIGRTAPPAQAGMIAGTVGAIGGLAGLVPPAVLGLVYGLTGSYAIGLTMLSSAALAGPVYLRAYRGFVGAALAFPAEGVPDETTLTVVALDAADATRNSQGVLAAVSALAVKQELVIVYGHPGGTAGLTPNALVAGLLSHLPRYTVLAICVTVPPSRREQELLAELLEEGAIPVAVTPPPELDAIATRLAGQLGAGQMLRLRHDRVDGVRLTLPWAAST